MSLILFWGSGGGAAVIPPPVFSDQIAMRVDLKVNGVWTEITDDVLTDPGLELAFGIRGNGPTDHIADVGRLSFALRNDVGNTGGLQGYYSPLHVNCRAGFTYGAFVRVVFTYLGAEYQRFLGKLVSIEPTPGMYGAQRTRVVVHDLMDDLIESDLRNVTLQVDKTETQLLAVLLSGLPTASQPLGLDFDAGLDTSPYAFDTLGAGAKAIGPATDIVLSARGYLHMLPTGVARYENRQHRQLASTTYTFDDDMVALSVPTSMDSVYNRVRVTYHPKTVDAAPTTVLWSQTGTAPPLNPSPTNNSIIIWGDYYNPTDPSVQIGGIEQVPPAATTDYRANTAPDGSGADKTANITVTAEYFASTVKFTVTNNDAGTVYLTFLQCRGKGLYDHAPRTVEASSVEDYGERSLHLDLPYQASHNTAVEIAEYVRSQYATLATQASEITFALDTATFRSAALNAQVGDRIEITETVTGLNSVAAFIQSIELRMEANLLLTCTLGLSSTTYFDFSELWELDDAVLSILDDTTVLGFA